MEQLFKTELEDVEINIHPNNLQETVYGANAEMSYIYDINTQSLSLHNEDSSEWEVYNNVCVVFEIEDGNEDFRIVIREIIIDIEKGGSTITVNL